METETITRTHHKKQEVLEAASKNPIAVIRELNNRSFYHFLQYFWPCVSAQKFQSNWHIEYLCGELEKTAERVAKRQPKEYDTIINISPGSTKTVTCSIMFPVWCWTKWYWMRFICASYSGALSLESADYCRDLLRSQEFQMVYPDIGIKEDKDVKSNFRIVKRQWIFPGRPPKTFSGGNRFSTSVGGTLVGFHGDILIVDDPINPTEAASDVGLANANHWVEQTLSTRKTDKAVTPTILIMQRLNQNDPTGHMLSKQKENIKHICIPGEIRNYRKQLSPPELAKFYVDDLMDVNRLPWSTLKDLEADLGQYGYAGQIGQNPTPPGGGTFKVDRFQFMALHPGKNQVVSTVRYWDKAGTKDAGAYTAGVKMSRLTNGRWLIEDVKRGRWASEEREDIIRQTAEVDGTGVEVGVEQEPGPIWEEEIVQMANGTRKKLKNIEKGDLVINGEGYSTKVMDVHIQGKLECLKITTDSGRIIHTSYDHPFFTPNGWVTACSLKLSDVLALKTDVQIETNNAFLLEECRLAGYFIGDGCCTWTRHRKVTCNSSISCSDKIEGIDIIHCVETLGYNVLLGANKKTYYLSNGIRVWLKRRGLAGKTTFTKVVPKWIVKSDKEYVANFLGAYFDCDGSVMSDNPKHSYVEYYSTNIELLKEVQSLLLRFGIYTMLRKRNLKPEFQKTRHTSYRLVMRRHDGSMGKFAKYIPLKGIKSTRLGGLNQIVFDQPYLSDPIVAIEKIGKLPCRCLSVQYGESFLVNDIVVHNSSGKDGAEGTIRNLAGFKVYAERPTGDKADRADRFSVQVNNGNVILLSGLWQRDYIEELRFFPYSTRKDMVDASSGAFNRLVVKKFVKRIT